MKIASKIVLSMTFTLLMALSFTSYVQAEPFKSQSFNGTTGLISTPTAHTGWEGNKLGLDLGYHHVHDGDKDRNSDGTYYIPTASLHIGIAKTSLEFAFAYDIQPDAGNNSKTNDMLFNGKWVFTKGLAIGGNYQRMQLNRHTKTTSNDKQIYLAATYDGTFFTMPAETTLVIGHTWYGKEHDFDKQNKSLDASIGFDLDILPKYLKHYVHWINDFANYSYSTEPGGANAYDRGCFNTGIRIAALKEKRYKLNFDVIMTDALDHNRDWALGIVFGLSL